ncbi:MAG: hypothetical protein KKB30_05315 [Proteobacteria bacterium]|nr:hypothetical protein [Pseudomonadota bacterium]MBU1716118.1 hypothetical protein [Pseudomonadota bacterium]
MESPLALIEYCFPVAQVVANPEREKNSDVNDIRFDAEVGVAESADGGLYQVTVEITSIDPIEIDKEKNPYDIHVVALGHFKVHPDWPDPGKLVRVNGASILYSAAREFIITITSRGPWGAITIPTKSFQTIVPNEPEKSCHEEKLID